MRLARPVSLVTLLAFVSAVAPQPARAAPADAAVTTASASPSLLRQSIDRAADSAAAQFPRVPPRAPQPVRNQMTGGGGGGGMMFMTLLMTAASLAGTYFLVKELRKSTETTTAAQ